MKKRKLTIAFLALLFLMAFSFLPVVPVLSICNRKNPSEKIHFKDAANGFVISYTHSVNKGRVHDYYRISGKNFILYKTEFVSYGAGMPEIEETPGAVFYQDDGTYAMNYERNLGKEFLLCVGVIARHSIRKTSGSHEFFLEDFFEPKTSLIFKIKRGTLPEWFFSHCL